MVLGVCEAGEEIEAPLMIGRAVDRNWPLQVRKTWIRTLPMRILQTGDIQTVKVPGWPHTHCNIEVVLPNLIEQGTKVRRPPKRDDQSMNMRISSASIS